MSRRDWLERVTGPALALGGAPATAAPAHVFRWDLDKTYLRTEFDSVRDLVNNALQGASDKQAYPGATALLRALAQPEHRICIVSGSPSQMRQVLAAKLALDGVSYDEFVLKNNLRNLLRGRLRALRSQLPYKLPALLQSRLASPPAPRETLFGDDAEADALIYCLYADILAGRVNEAELRQVLAAARAYPDEFERVLALARSAPRGAVVKRIFIHLDRRSPPLGFGRFGARVVPVHNYFQSALVLYQDEVLTARQVLFVAHDMLAAGGYEIAALANSLEDITRRHHVRQDALVRLLDQWQAVVETGDSPKATPLRQPLIDILRQRLSQLRYNDYRIAPDGARLDYAQLVGDESRHRKHRRRHGLGAS